MNSAHILIVDDEAAIREMVRNTLTLSGYSVAEAADGQEAVASVYAKRPDLILLDWMLPGISGIEIIRKIKRDEMMADIPVIMLTAKSAEENLIQGLSSGADDFVTKPFSPRELVARMEAVLRRTGSSDRDVLSIGGLALHANEHRAYIDGVALEMGPTEFRLLSFFMLHPNRVYSRAQLLDLVWGGEVYLEERTVDVHIRRLRKALQSKSLSEVASESFDYGQLVETVRGAGYLFNTKAKNLPAGTSKGADA